MMSIDLLIFFKGHQLTLEKSVKYGMRILGSEFKKRITEAAVLNKIVGNQYSQILNRLQAYFEKTQLSLIGQLILDAEEEFDLVVSDHYYVQFIIQIAIMIEHIYQGKICDNIDGDFKENSLEDKVAHFIKERIENDYHITISRNDFLYLYISIVGLKYQNKTIYQNRSIENIRHISPQTFDNIKEILREVDAVYGENLSDDDEFITSLFIHLNALFTRLLNSIYLENPLKKNIKADLAYEYEIAAYISQLLAREKYCVLKEDDICDIALYIGASFQRKKRKSLNKKTTVVIVCGSGMSTSQFLEAKIKLDFPQVIVKETIPLIKAKELKKDNQDFVISTVPLHLDNIEVINVSPMFNDKDFELMNSRINYSYQYNNENGLYFHLLSTIKENICFFNCDCRSREEVINLMSARLMNQKYVDEGFVNSVMKREKLAPTSIGDGFAIPHSFKGHVLKPGIGFMTLKKPIQWGEEKVQMVLMIALDPDEEAPFKLIFSQLATLTKDVNRIQKILEAKNYKDFKKALR